MSLHPPSALTRFWAWYEYTRLNDWFRAPLGCNSA